MDAQTTATEIPAVAAEGVAEGIAGAPPLPTIPPNVIVAHLPHPVIHGTPLSRGARYIHNFAVELVSTGHGLIAACSDEGKALIAALAEESRREHDAIEAHKAKQAEI